MSDGKVVIHTDGACSGNPGPGGWGAILEHNGRIKELSGGEAVTTNNRMELMAAISALEALNRPCTVEMHTDSQYLRNGISSWIHGWKRNGWRTAEKTPVKNADLWRRLDAALQPHKVSWHWVRGHSGHDLNERADMLACQGMAPFRHRRNEHHDAQPSVRGAPVPVQRAPSHKMPVGGGAQPPPQGGRRRRKSRSAAKAAPIPSRRPTH